METSHPLSIESFSYSWLVNLNPSPLESLNSSLRASFDASDDNSSFIEMDPRMPPSKRFFISKKNSKDFKFDFPASSDSPLTVVHADQLFSNGYLIPFFEKKDSSENPDDSCLLQPTSSSLAMKKSSPPAGATSSASSSSSLRRCRRLLLSKRLLHKYLDFFLPLYRRLRGHRKSTSSSKSETGKRVHNLQTARSWMYSPESSSRISVAYSGDDGWRRPCSSESSIYEAVLHCKRSIEK